MRIQTNSQYPTIESMFSLYLGVYNKDFLTYGGPLPANVIKMSVSKLIRVKLTFKLKLGIKNLLLLNFN